MKKLVMLCLVVLTIQSCSKVQYMKYKLDAAYYDYKINKMEKEFEKTKGDCSQDIVKWINYEDTIEKIFLCVDSNVFKNKNLNDVNDSLMFIGDDNLYSMDFQNKKTGYIFRVWYDCKKCDPRNVYLKEEYILR